MLGTTEKSIFQIRGQDSWEVLCGFRAEGRGRVSVIISS